MRVTISGKVIFEPGETEPIVTPQDIRSALDVYDMLLTDLARALSYTPDYADNISAFINGSKSMPLSFRAKFRIWLDGIPKVIRAWEPVPIIIHRDKLAGSIHSVRCVECATRLQLGQKLTDGHTTYKVGNRQTDIFLTTNIQRTTCCSACRSAWKTRTRKKK